MNTAMLWERCFAVHSFTQDSPDVVKACKRGIKRQATVGGQFLLPDAHEWIVLVLISQYWWQSYNNFGHESLECGCLNYLELGDCSVCWPYQNHVIVQQ